MTDDTEEYEEAGKQQKGKGNPRTGGKNAKRGEITELDVIEGTLALSCCYGHLLFGIRP